MASPISGVVGAALPVAVGAVVEGLPAWTRGLGFALALAGIGLVTRSASGAARASRGQIALSVLSGLGFGGFFLLVAQIGEGAVLAPLAVAKGAALCVAGAVILHGRVRRGVVPFRGRGVVWLSGALDAGANACYLLAAQQTRMDVAVVLSSLYPAVTVLLARAVLAERITRAQWAGVGLCTAAIALIAA